MRQIREMLRLSLEVGLSYRAIGQTLGVSHLTVSRLLQRFRAAGGTWPLSADVTDATLTQWLYPGNLGRPRRRPEPEWAWVHRELRRKHVTLELLWREYKQQHPDGYQYTQFCEHYRRYRQQVDVVLRKVYRPGEFCFVDYAGDPVPVVDPRTGAIHPAQLFVAVLGYSNYTFVELHRDQTRAAWLDGHRHACVFR